MGGATDLARWQFGVTTLYHFIFVPLTIGMSMVVAAVQTAWVRTGKAAWLRATRFWGKLFLINMAMGVVTGIVQEFQFGMNWSSYSRYVGDIFGAPLAMEGLLAFFLESTFIGLWIFGWGRLGPRLHLATIWLAAFGTVVSAFFILMANAWMQHPVGYVINHARGRAELRDFGAVLTNPTVWVEFPHTVLAAVLTAAALVLGISVWKLARHSDDAVFLPCARAAMVTSVVMAALVGFSGHEQAQVMTRQQPMKMAAAEALYHGQSGAPFSLFAIGDVSQAHLVFDLRLPRMLSVLATNTFDGYVAGIDDVQAQEQARYGPGDYRPIIPLTYWTFRIMTGMAFLSGLLGALGLWLLWRGRSPGGRWYTRAALAGIALPVIGNFTGWIFTEMGRQPWVVYGLLRTSDGVSPSVSGWTVGLSLGGFTLLYGVLAVIEGGLMVRFARHETLREDGADEDIESMAAAMAY